jgi:hypothetical protein
VCTVTVRTRFGRRSLGMAEPSVQTGFADRELTGTASPRYGPLALREESSRVCATERVHSVEVKIGVTDSARELVFNSAQTPTEVEKLITDALGQDAGVLSLTDEKGRRFLVQTSKITYVEIGAADTRRVGFGVVGAEAVKNA